MSWLIGKSIATYQDIFDRTAPASGFIFTLNSGESLIGSSRCITIGDAQIKIALDPNGIPSGLNPKRLARREWLIPSAITQQTIFTGFASPVVSSQVNENLFYTDPSLNGIIYFNPLTITGGTVGSGNPENPKFIDMGSGTRPTGAYTNNDTNRMYVNSYNGGGLTVIDCITFSVIKTISYGSDGPFSRGNVYFIDNLNEIWAVGNSGFLRIDATTEVPITGGTWSGFTAQGSVYATSINNKIYVVYDGSNNFIRVYDLTLNLLNTITGLCQNVSNNGQNVSRGYYTDYNKNTLYLGETSVTGGITVVDVISDTISMRFPIAHEGRTYSSPGVINFHPLRNLVYIGGSLFNDTTDAVSRIWSFDIMSGITQTIIPSVPSGGTGISSIFYYSWDGINNVYVGSAGQIPESVPNTDQFTDGIIINFT